MTPLPHQHFWCWEPHAWVHHLLYFWPPTPIFWPESSQTVMYEIVFPQGRAFHFPSDRCHELLQTCDLWRKYLSFAPFLKVKLSFTNCMHSLVSLWPADTSSHLVTCLFIILPFWCMHVWSEPRRTSSIPGRHCSIYPQLPQVRSSMVFSPIFKSVVSRFFSGLW